MTKKIYDKIANSYLRTDLSLTKKYVAAPTFIKLVGRTKNKRVIDFGCGSGYSTRLMTGASLLVGVDSSLKQINLARKIEKIEKRGIIYSQADINKSTFLKFKEFDKVTAMYLLHYASTKEELYIICKNIARSLKSGGKFIAINSNPDFPEQTNRKYGITATFEGNLVEGARRKVVYLLFNEEICSFNTYFWKKETYEGALQKAGFRNIKWYLPIVSQEGLDVLGKGFWKELLEKPFICGLTATKS